MEPLAGITTPAQLQDLMQGVGYRHVQEDASTLCAKDVHNLMKASELKAKGHRVVILIQHQILAGGLRADSEPGIPDHWVELDDPVKTMQTPQGLLGYLYVFDTASQAVRRHPPKEGAYQGLNWFCRFYFGYVAGRA